MATERPFGSESGGFGRRLHPDTLSADKGLGDLSVERSFIDAGDQRRILEVLVRLGRKKEKPEGQSARRLTTNGWESFTKEPEPNQRFINLYNGPYATQMELARAKIEQLLNVAAIDGNVVLTMMPTSREDRLMLIRTDQLLQRENCFGAKNCMMRMDLNLFGLFLYLKVGESKLLIKNFFKN